MLQFMGSQRVRHNLENQQRHASPGLCLEILSLPSETSKGRVRNSPLGSEEKLFWFTESAFFVNTLGETVWNKMRAHKTKCRDATGLNRDTSHCTAPALFPFLILFRGSMTRAGVYFSSFSSSQFSPDFLCPFCPHFLLYIFPCSLPHHTPSIRKRGQC